VVEDLRREAPALGPWVHQIHACDGELYVADTKNGRLIRYLVDRDCLKWERSFYANGWLRKNEVHVNSVYCDNNEIYLVYHNKTRHTGRKSQIAVLNRAMQLTKIIDTQAGSAHNIAIWKSTPIYCDSDAGSLVWDEPVLHFDCFTRGLAISDHFVLVGGSEFAEREDRAAKTGYVFVIDLNEKTLISRITIPAIGSILELRLIEPTDYGMSGTNRLPAASRIQSETSGPTPAR
jgi:hypothetical protein